MDSHYKRAMEAVSLSPEARERIQARMERPRRGRRILRCLALAAAVAALMFAIATNATANVEGTYPHEMDDSIARALVPVELSCTDQGVNIVVEAAAVKNGQLYFYFTIDDGGSGLLDYGVEITGQGQDWDFDLFGRVPASGDEKTYGVYFLGYDEQTGTYGHLGILHIRNGLGITTDPSGMTAVMSISKLAVGLPDGSGTMEELHKIHLSPDEMEILEGNWKIEFPIDG